MKAAIVRNTKGEARIQLQLETAEERELLGNGKNHTLSSLVIGTMDDVFSDVSYQIEIESSDEDEPW